MLPDDLHSEFVLSSLQLVLRRVAAVKHLPVHHHSADYIFSVFSGIIWLILCQFENRVPLKPLLRGDGAVLPHCITAHKQDSIKPSLLFSFL